MSLLKHEILNKNPKRTSEIALRVFLHHDEMGSYKDSKTVAKFY